MTRLGNTTIIVTIALCVVLCVAMACGTVIYLGGKPGGGGTVVEATYREQLEPILDGTAAPFYSGVFDAMAVDLDSDQPTAKTWVEYQSLKKRLGSAANNGEPISVNLTPVILEVFSWADGKQGAIASDDRKRLADTFRALGEAAKDCE